jgi:nucleotide-binding universal stress UspA family protein
MKLVSYLLKKLSAMETIILPTDFSPVATNAMNYAVDMAMELNASLLLFHVYQIPVSYNSNADEVVPLPVIDINELEKINKERLSALKEEIEHVTSGKIKIFTELKMGVLVNELEALCETVQPFAVVMGNKGAGLIERLLVGSSALSTIRRLNWPVLIVPPGAVFKGLQKIGYTCDFKDVSDTTPVEILKEWTMAFGAELEILNVNYNRDSADKKSREQEEMLRSILGEINPKFFFINNQDVEKGVHEFAESNNVDLLIVVPRKHNLLESLFQKSHSKDLVFHSHIPILSVHRKE